MKRRGRPVARGREPPDEIVTRWDPSEIMTVPQVAEYLHCHPSTIYRLVRQQQIPGFWVGGVWRFKRSVIDEWIRHRGA